MIPKPRLLAVAAILISLSVSAHAGVMGTATAHHVLTLESVSFASLPSSPPAGPMDYSVGVALQDGSLGGGLNTKPSFVLDWNGEGSTVATSGIVIGGAPLGGESGLKEGQSLDVNLTAKAERLSGGFSFAESTAIFTVTVTNRTSNQNLLFGWSYFSDITASIADAETVFNQRTATSSSYTGLFATPPAVVPPLIVEAGLGFISPLDGNQPLTLDSRSEPSFSFVLSPNQTYEMTVDASAFATASILAVPEPSTMAVWSMLAIGTVLPRRRRR